MNTNEIIKRCVEKLGMSPEEARWVAENLYNYASPDFSEWSWEQIDECFKDVLFFKDKTDAEVTAALAG
jgi:hypothetical protein